MALVILHLQDAAGKPLGEVVASSTGGPGPWQSVTNACGDVIDPDTHAAGVTLSPGDYSITFSKAGYQMLTLVARIQECGIITQALERSTGSSGGPLAPQAPTVMRAPLGAYPEPVTYPTTLPFTPPTARDLHFYRGNFCGLRIPGAQPAPGSNDQNPELVMACLLDNYPADVQDRYLETYASYGYTHLQRSLGHAIWYGHTLDDYIALSHRARAHGLFCDHWFLGGGEGDGGSNPFKARDQTASYWGPFLQPYLDGLLTAGVVDAACVGWQLDQFNAPGNPLISIIAWLGGALPGEVPLFTHWVNHALAWWADKGQQWTDEYQSIWVCDRFTWWAAMQPYLTGGHHQGSNEEAIHDPKLYQDKLLDTLEPFGGETGKGNMGQSHRGGVVRNFAMTAWEVTAQYQFDNRCSEDQGDLTGYLTMCTTSSRGNGMAGYGNGARMPNGGVL